MVGTLQLNRHLAVDLLLLLLLLQMKLEEIKMELFFSDKDGFQVWQWVEWYTQLGMFVLRCVGTWKISVTERKIPVIIWKPHVPVWKKGCYGHILHVRPPPPPPKKNKQETVLLSLIRRWNRRMCIKHLPIRPVYTCDTQIGSYNCLLRSQAIFFVGQMN